MRSGPAQISVPSVRVWALLQDEPISPLIFKKALLARRRALDEVQREAREAAAVAAAAAAAATAAVAAGAETLATATAATTASEAEDTKMPAVVPSNGDHVTERDSNEQLVTVSAPSLEQQKPSKSAPAALAGAVVCTADAAAAKTEQRKQRQKARRAAARAQLEATRDAKMQRKAELEQRQSASTQDVEALKARLEVVEQEKHRLVGQLRQVLQAEGLQRRPSVVTLGAPGEMGQSVFSPSTMQQQQQLHPQQLVGVSLRTASTGLAIPQASGIGDEALLAGAVASSAANQPPYAPQVSPFGTGGFVSAAMYGTLSTAPIAFNAAEVAGSCTPRTISTAAAGSRSDRTTAEEEDEGEIREDGEYGIAGPGPCNTVSRTHPTTPCHPPGSGHAPYSVGGSGLGPGVPAAGPLGAGLGPSAGSASIGGPIHGASSSQGPPVHGLGHGSGAPHAIGSLGHGPGPGSGTSHVSGFGGVGIAGAGAVQGTGLGHGHGGPSSSAYPDPSRRSVGGAMFPEARPSILQAQQPQMGMGMPGPSGVGPGPGHAAQMPMRMGQGGRGGGWGPGPNPPFGVQGGLHPHHGLGPPMGRGSGAFGGRMLGGGWRDDEVIGDGLPYSGYGRGRGMGGFPMQGPPRRNW